MLRLQLVAADGESKVGKSARGYALFIDGGDHLRDQVGDDLLLAHALRVLLPPYPGH